MNFTEDEASIVAAAMEPGGYDVPMPLAVIAGNLIYRGALKLGWRGRVEATAEGARLYDEDLLESWSRKG